MGIVLRIFVWSNKHQKRRAGKNNKLNFLCGPKQPIWDPLFEPPKLETFLVGALYREFREFMRILTTFLGKPTDIHQNSGVSAVCANYDGFLWFFSKESRQNLHEFPKFSIQCTCYKSLQRNPPKELCGSLFAFFARK